MALPKIKHPTYKVKLTSLKKSVDIRPFTVQEEKLLLMTAAANDSDSIISTIKQIINNCVLDDIDVDKLASFDIEYIFLKLRAKSVGEIVKLVHTDPEEGSVEYEVNLEDVEVKVSPEHKNKFLIHEKIGVIMKYPSIDQLKTIMVQDEDAITESETENIFKMLISCIESVYDDEKLYTDFTSDELYDFIMSMPMESLQKLQNFFETMPSVELTKEISLPSGKKKEIKVKGITSFFTL